MDSGAESQMRTMARTIDVHLSWAIDLASVGEGCCDRCRNGRHAQQKYMGPGKAYFASALIVHYECH
jgi:hypothetical protein